MSDEPTDESRAQSSTGEESCAICDGTGTQEALYDEGDSRPCHNCGGTGIRPRPAHVDAKPTIAPGKVRHGPDCHCGWCERGRARKKQD